MKNYTRKREDDTNYIVSCTLGDDDTIEVKFADGTIYRPEATEENIRKVRDAMESQVTQGLTNYSYFKRNGFVSAAITILGAGASVIAASSETAALTQTAATVVMGAGSLTSILGFAGFIKNQGILSELDKFKVRNEHQADLEKLNRYRYALVNLPRKLREHINNHDDPFNALYADLYSSKHITTISKEIAREKTYNFTYSKTK